MTDSGIRVSDPAARRRLLARWDRLLPAASEIGALVGEDLVCRWSAPARRYHNTLHLTEVLDRLRRLPGGRDVSVRLAAWFHDAVYEPAAPPGASEEASAVLLETLAPECGFDEAQIRIAARLVRLTGTHDPGDDDVAGAALIDADLAILAAPPDRYLDYAAGVRAEYAHLPDADFAAGRAAVLDHLLDHHPMFSTPAGRRDWESAARANVAIELRMLRSAG